MNLELFKELKHTYDVLRQDPYLNEPEKPLYEALQRHLNSLNSKSTIKVETDPEVIKREAHQKLKSQLDIREIGFRNLDNNKRRN